VENDVFVLVDHKFVNEIIKTTCNILRVFTFTFFGKNASRLSLI